MRQLALAALFALTTAPAFAQDAQDTRALAEKYVTMPQVQGMITEMFSPEAMGAQFAASLSESVDVTENQQSRVGEVMSDAMEGLRPRMEALMVEGSAETFTADELNALIDFYGSEHGAAVMTKMQPFMQGVMAQLAPEMRAFEAEVGPQIMEIMREGN